MILRIITVAFLIISGPALGQGTGISLSPVDIDAGQAVEVTADNLSVEQNSNTATFSGNARVVQGDLILAAQKIVVRYNDGQSAIERVDATTNVMFTNGKEVAEGQKGTYYVSSGKVDMSGSVVLVQGPNAMSGDTLTLDLKTSRGTMSGNVKTVFIPKTDQ